MHIPVYCSVVLAYIKKFQQNFTCKSSIDEDEKHGALDNMKSLQTAKIKLIYKHLIYKQLIRYLKNTIQ